MGVDETIESVTAALQGQGISLPEDELAELVAVASAVHQMSQTLRDALKAPEDPISVLGPPLGSRYGG